MTQTAIATSAPLTEWAPAVPSAIDSAHLARMTFGDRSLEREVLQLFDRQAAILVDRMRGSEPGLVSSLAHTLKGSALNVGARRVAKASEAMEAAAGASSADYAQALGILAQTVVEARERIAEMLWLGD